VKAQVRVGRLETYTQARTVDQTMHGLRHGDLDSFRGVECALALDLSFITAEVEHLRPKQCGVLSNQLCQGFVGLPCGVCVHLRVGTEGDAVGLER
jgi:hypothetical protein